MSPLTFAQTSFIRSDIAEHFVQQSGDAGSRWQALAIARIHHTLVFGIEINNSAFYITLHFLKGSTFVDQTSVNPIIVEYSWNCRYETFKTPCK
jgi:hypothetical protein